MTNTVPNLPRKVPHDEMVAFKVDQNGPRREIVQRDDDIRTPQQVQQNWLEVESAMQSYTLGPH